MEAAELEAAEKHKLEKSLNTTKTTADVTQSLIMQQDEPEEDLFGGGDDE